MRGRTVHSHEVNHIFIYLKETSGRLIFRISDIVICIHSPCGIHLTICNGLFVNFCDYVMLWMSSELCEYWNDNSG